MKKIIIALLIPLLLAGCGYDYRVSSLKHRELTFGQLPTEVKNSLKQASEKAFSDATNTHSDILAVNKADCKRYTDEIVWSKLVSSWVHYIKIIDNEKNITYKIEQGAASPYIIYKEKLYIPQEYNILTIDEYMRTCKYIEYELK